MVTIEVDDIVSTVEGTVQALADDISYYTDPETGEEVTQMTGHACRAFVLGIIQQVDAEMRPRDPVAAPTRVSLPFPFTTPTHLMGHEIVTPS